MSARKPTLADLLDNRMVVVDGPAPDDLLSEKLLEGIVWVTVGDDPQPNPLHVNVSEDVPDWVDRKPVSYPLSSRPVDEPPARKRSPFRRVMAAFALAAVLLAIPSSADARHLSHEVAFVVPAGTITHLATECVAQDQAVFSLSGRPFVHRWNADHDRLVFSSRPGGARVVFDGEAFHNHTHGSVVALVSCGR